MRIACDKCNKLTDPRFATGWLKVRTNYDSEFHLCPDCEHGFWQAVDSDYPPIPRTEAQHDRA